MQTKAVVNSTEITNSALLLLKIYMIPVRNCRIIITFYFIIHRILVLEKANIML